jgi:phosphohistidine phosphatase
MDDAVYHAGPDGLLARLRQVPPEVESVLLVGHNPGLQGLATGLVGDGKRSLRERLTTKFPTGALATLEVPRAWHDLRWGAATIVALVTPRDL